MGPPPRYRSAVPPARPDASRLAHRAAVAAGIVIGAAGALGVALTGRYGPALLADAGLGVLFAVECIVAERFASGPVVRRAVRASARAAWGLTFALWSAILYSLAVAMLRGGDGEIISPKTAHADLRTHLEAATIFLVATALATTLTAAVLCVCGPVRRVLRSAALALAATGLLGGGAILLAFPERPWLAGGGACAAASLWHLLISGAIFAPDHSRTGAGNDTGPRRPSES